MPNHSASYLYGKNKGFWIGFIFASLAYPIFLGSGVVYGMLYVHRYEYNTSLVKSNDFMADVYKSGYLNYLKFRDRQKEKEKSNKLKKEK